MLEHPPASRSIGTEDVERQRSRPCVDIGNGILEFAIGHNREDRAEDFLVHHVHLVGNAQQKLRREQPRLRA